MVNFYNNAEKWIENEDSVCKQSRIERSVWLAENTPTSEIFIFHGGLITNHLFEEARYCFVYGQNLATITLGLSFVEHTLASIFYASGRNNLVQATFSILLDEAFKEGWVNEKEQEGLIKANRIRNSVLHFRKPLEKNTLEYRTMDINNSTYEIIEEDAKHVLSVVFNILKKYSIK